MHIRIEVYEDGGRLFVDGLARETRDREIDIEDMFPLLRELGATVEAVQYEAFQRDIGFTRDMINTDPGHDFSY